MMLQWGHGDEAVEETTTAEMGWGTHELQWGHGDEAVEEVAAWPRKRAGRRRFNGATAMKPWKRARHDCRDSPYKCFNGATAMKPWKRPPRAFPRGPRSCFNGATAMKPWKSRCPRRRG